MPVDTARLWATEDDLPTRVTDPPEPWTWDDILAVASEALYQASGQQYRGTSQVRAQFISRPGSCGGGAGPWVGSAYPTRGPRRGRELMVVKLPSSPVTDCDGVYVGDSPLDRSVYACTSAGLLERLDGDRWPLDGSLTVDYTTGVEVPLGGKLAAVALAVELAKCVPGATGGTSRLANMITSMVREGTSVTAITVNLREAITSGFTGLPEVDLWIASINRHQMPVFASSVATPDIPQGRLVPRTPR